MMVSLPVPPVMHTSIWLLAPALAGDVPVTYGWSHSTTTATKSPGGIAGIVKGRAVVFVAPVVSKFSSNSPAFDPLPGVLKTGGAVFS